MMLEQMKAAGLEYVGESTPGMPWLRRDVVKGISGSWLMDGKTEVFKPYSTDGGSYNTMLFAKVKE